ncbi:MAG: transferrin-binding protein-like solute binding protein [Boseongicola sp. SB0664_bin_43]|uniref:Transferrin-binding protein-like solute binding protein n=1 Tax=Boseongicola sp. SB0664_bin_43 TaxID=2604844 RepID=A0A6B0XZA8_9RHOB|nr:transferrin-binding protein-like solute binding protein [Boseongicola sp. SB0664_bin_43]
MPINHAPLHVSMAVAVASALTGCGGGGSSGSLTVPGDGSTTGSPAATLHSTGEYRATVIDGTPEYDFVNWGLWGGELRADMVTCTAIGCPPAGDPVFWAYLDGGTGGSIIPSVEGMRSGNSPTSGSAAWTGGVRAYERQVMHSGTAPATASSPVEGESRLEVDLASGTIDVKLTSFDDDRADMSWSGLTLDHGEFGGATLGIEGSFYGSNHEGAAGTFDRDGLAGVFGALRTSGQATEATATSP